MTIIFIIAFFLCFLSYTLHTITHLLEFKGKRVPQFIDRSPHHPLHFGYLAWIIMLFTDPISLKATIYSIIIGIIVGTIGLIIMVKSMKARKETGENLITTGIYSKLRHPMYIGMTLIMIGYPFATGSFLTLLSAVIWVSQMMVWRYWEEKELTEKFGQEYMDYKKRTVF